MHFLAVCKEPVAFLFGNIAAPSSYFTNFFLPLVSRFSIFSFSLLLYPMISFLPYNFSPKNGMVLCSKVFLVTAIRFLIDWYAKSSSSAIFSSFCSLLMYRYVIR